MCDEFPFVLPLFWVAGGPAEQRLIDDEAQPEDEPEDWVADGPAEPRFVGTGTLVALDLVLTCRHVVPEPDGAGGYSDNHITVVALRSGAGDVDVSGQVMRVHDHVRDLALVRLKTAWAGPVVPFLTGLHGPAVVWLLSQPWHALGFPAEERGEELRDYQVTPVLHGRRLGSRTLADVQLQGGLPEGCSGGPILVHLPDGTWACLGVIRLGGERSATSRIILADMVLEFLHAHGITPATRTLPEISPPARTGRAMRRGARFVAACLLALMVLPTLLLWLLRDPGPHPMASQPNVDPSLLKDHEGPSTNRALGVRYRGRVDVMIERDKQLLKLNQPGPLPMRQDDKFRIKGEIDPPAYVYVVWVDPGQDVTPVYPWDPEKGWGSRPAKEEQVEGVSLPPNTGKRYTAPDAKPGVATIVLFASPTPLDIPDLMLKGWFEGLHDLPLPPGGEQAAVWFDDYLEVRDPDRARTFGVVGSDDPFARWQGQLQQVFGGKAAFQTAVSFARTGGK